MRELLTLSQYFAVALAAGFVTFFWFLLSDGLGGEYAWGSYSRFFYGWLLAFAAFGLLRLAVVSAVGRLLARRSDYS
ncbi:MAG TPA: hypothetical protein VIP46_20275 [Pyrinomonadaceae bacterium]